MSGEPFPISIRGTIYPSARAAADAFGVRIGYIHDALNKGKLDRVGLDRYPQRRPGAPSPVSLPPYTFISRTELARLINRTPWTVTRALKTPRGRERLLRLLADSHMATGTNPPAIQD